MALGRFGYDRAAVTEIQDSVAALNALKAQSYDMVLCGIYLDSLDGLGIMRALRAWEAEQGLPTPIQCHRRSELAFFPLLHAHRFDLPTERRRVCHYAKARLSPVVLVSIKLHNALYKLNHETLPCGVAQNPMAVREVLVVGWSDEIDSFRSETLAQGSDIWEVFQRHLQIRAPSISLPFPTVAGHTVAARLCAT